MGSDDDEYVVESGEEEDERTEAGSKASGKKGAASSMSAKQQKVAVGDVIEIDKVTTPVGETLSLPVVMAVDGETVTATGLADAAVTVEVLGLTKGPKIVIQKYKNKTGYKKRQGHRQDLTRVKVTGIK